MLPSGHLLLKSDVTMYDIGEAVFRDRSYVQKGKRLWASKSHRQEKDKEVDFAFYVIFLANKSVLFSVLLVKYHGFLS